MSGPLQIPADPGESIWVFGLDLPDAEAEAVIEGGPGDSWPLKKLLGADTLKASHIEAFPASDLSGVGLPGYLVEGLGIDETAIAPDRALLKSANRHIVILRGPAFGGVAQTLTPRVPLVHLGTYQPVQTEQRLVPLPLTGAESVISPTPGMTPPPQMPNSGRGLWGLVAGAVVVLILAYVLLGNGG